MKELEVRMTRDGTRTLFDPLLSERYHSVHGAVAESRHVFLDAGFLAAKEPRVDVLEIGLGTGLNMLLTWIESENRCIEVHYDAVEPFPLNTGILNQLDHCTSLGVSERSLVFMGMMQGPHNTRSSMRDFHFRMVADGSTLTPSGYHVIYFDAFAPAHQPGMWTVEMFERMRALLRPGGVLVTYCAKGDVRRAMQRAGFSVERLPGPPGKKEMLRAINPG